MRDCADANRATAGDIILRATVTTMSATRRRADQITTAVLIGFAALVVLFLIGVLVCYLGYRRRRAVWQGRADSVSRDIGTVKTRIARLRTRIAKLERDRMVELRAANIQNYVSPYFGELQRRRLDAYAELARQEALLAQMGRDRVDIGVAAYTAEGFSLAL